MITNQASGGKVLHYHDDSDCSISAAFSINYHESVRRITYPNASFNDSGRLISD